MAYNDRGGRAKISRFAGPIRPFSYAFAGVSRVLGGRHTVRYVQLASPPSSEFVCVCSAREEHKWYASHCLLRCVLVLVCWCVCSWPLSVIALCFTVCALCVWYRWCGGV